MSISREAILQVTLYHCSIYHSESQNESIPKLKSMIGEIDVGIFCDIHLCLETVSKEYPDGNILSNKLLAFHNLG